MQKLENNKDSNSEMDEKGKAAESLSNTTVSLQKSLEDLLWEEAKTCGETMLKFLKDALDDRNIIEVDLMTELNAKLHEVIKLKNTLLDENEGRIH